MPRDTYKWAANSLIDGSVPLNSIPHADLQGGDLCVVIKQGDCAYHYVYDGLSEAPQDVPNVIAPQDAGANPGRWVLHRVYDTLSNGGTIDDTVIGGTTPAAGSFTTITLGGVTRSAWPAGGTWPENVIGPMGSPGAGVGICPEANLPSGMMPIDGTYDIYSANFGNYQFRDGSICVYIPKFYYRIAHADNPTYGDYGVNSIDIKGTETYADETAANAAGYALPTIFINGGTERDGIFIDKYMCSKQAWGTGYIASSLPFGNPISTHAAHNPAADCTGGANYYYTAIDLPKRRDGENGEEGDGIFFCNPREGTAMLALLSLAHGQASSSTTYCAWYDATYNYPKGLNNNQAPVDNIISNADCDDNDLTYVSDGYDNCGQTGSGTPFAKTTHNGQACGVADVNGLMWEVSPGVTSIVSSKSIEGMSKANPCVVTITDHGLTTGDWVMCTSDLNDSWNTIKNKVWQITKITDDTFSIDLNSTGFEDYTSTNSFLCGIFYRRKLTTSFEDFTSGASGATDHWGATGIAAMMERFVPAFVDGGAFVQKYGSGANQVLAEDLSGDPYRLTSLGFPQDGDGADTTGTNLFGKDYWYQYIRDDLCLLSSGNWYHGAGAGGWHAAWNNTRANSSVHVGFRSACYPVAP